MKNSRAVVYMGPAGSYTEMAAKQFCKNLGMQGCELILQPSILKVIDYVDNCTDGLLGVIPIENSIEGIVRETVDNLLLAKSSLFIQSETVLPISHCLISKASELNTIKKIISYTQALAQCQRFMADNLPAAGIINSSSTSEAVKQLLELDETYAAIGSEYAAEIYGLNVLRKEINDHSNNQTRFVLIGREQALQTGEDKTSIVFSTQNKPGDLVRVLNIFDRAGLNLSYIESRPSKKCFGEYNFFIDFEGHIEDTIVKDVLVQIEPYITFYRFLGSYPAFKK